MTTLNLQYNNLKRLSDLSEKSYQTILLDKNYIRYLYSELLPRSLKHLSVSQNELTSLHLEQSFPFLEGLDVERNDLHSLYLDDLFLALKTLRVQKNKLTKTDFLCHTPHLDHLDLSFNEFEILQHLPSSLQTLKANFCRLSMIQSRLPATLTECTLLGNSLRMGSLPLNWGTHLRTLNLGQNELKEFPKRLPDSLEELCLHCNQIERIPDKLPSSLKHLNLAFNSIRQLPTKTNVRLQLLIVNGNTLTQDFEKEPVQWTRDLLSEFNWNEEKHQLAQRKLKNCWKRYILCKRLRHFVRARSIYEELLMVTLHPDRILQTDTFSPGWSISCV